MTAMKQASGQTLVLSQKTRSRVHGVGGPNPSPTPQRHLYIIRISIGTGQRIVSHLIDTNRHMPCMLALKRITLQPLRTDGLTEAETIALATNGLGNSIYSATGSFEQKMNKYVITLYT